MHVGKSIGTLGIVLTAIYLAAWGTLVYHRSDKFAGMELNAIGDFLGGSFAPLAFLWLVLGFFQQGVELRQNSAALELQAKELAESAVQQRELVRATREQLALEQTAFQEERARLRRKDRPIFVLHREVDARQDGRKRMSHIFTNIGAACTFPRMILEGVDEETMRAIQLTRGINNHDRWNTGEKGNVSYFLDGTNHPRAKVTLAYIDANGEADQQVFELVDGRMRPADRPD